jgi:small-conductance mechanosensitive channel
MWDILSNKYVVGLGIIVGTVIVAQILNFILAKIIKFTAKTKTKIDDLIINEIKSPLKIIIITIGLFISFKYIYPDFAIGLITLEKIFTVIWVLAGAFLVTKIINAIFEWYTEELQHKVKRKIDNTIFQFIRKIVNIIIYILAFLMVLNGLGVEITPLLAGLGIGGLAIALALKDTLANFFGALFLTIDRPMKIGDFIEIDDKTSGHVHDIGWRTTRIKTWDGNYIIVPNSQIADALLRNYDAPKSNMKFAVPCSVSYNSDLDKVEKIVVDEAKKVLKGFEGAVKDSKPSISFTDFGDSAINFKVIFEVKDRSYKFSLRHEFIKALHKRFKKEKIEIPFPQTDIWMRK